MMPSDTIEQLQDLISSLDVDIATLNVDIATLDVDIAISDCKEKTWHLTDLKLKKIKELKQCISDKKYQGYNLQKKERLEFYKKQVAEKKALIVVEEGEYSSRGIVGIYSDPKIAIEMAEAANETFVSLVILNTSYRTRPYHMNLEDLATVQRPKVDMEDAEEDAAEEDG